jgi:hypothetical protein
MSEEEEEEEQVAEDFLYAGILCHLVTYSCSAYWGRGMAFGVTPLTARLDFHCRLKR